MTKSYVHYGDNLKVIRKIKDESVDLVYIDPPFNTGKVQSRVNKKAVRSEEPTSQKGFCGNSYDLVTVGNVASYSDSYDDYLSFLRDRLVELKRVLKPSGSLYLHLDYREAAYARILGDTIFGRDNFLNEIIWAYDYGAKPKTRWPTKHDNILMWVKSKGKHFFGIGDIDRIPYMAPGMVGTKKSARGKLPTDCYSADTEVLTSSGWKLFPCVTSQDSLATVSPAGELSYVLPEKLHSYEYSGPMVQFKTKTVDLLVTPNHNMYARRKGASTYGFVPAVDLLHMTSCSYVSFTSKLSCSEGSGVVSSSLPLASDYRSEEVPFKFLLEDWGESTVWGGKGHSFEVPYSGMVYCATVNPYHTLVVRRNGKSSICGNCWWHTIVSPTGKEKTGYPTQKPIGVLERIIRTSCPEGGVVLDCFAGSGTTGEAALRNGRNFILVDSNLEAIRTMRKRFHPYLEAGKKISYLKSK